MEQLQSIWQIDAIICQEMAKRRKPAYEEELTRLLEVYRSLLKKFSYNGECCAYEDETIGKYVKKLIPTLKKMARNYALGDVLTFNTLANRLFGLRVNRFSAAAYFQKATISKGTYWYRARTIDTSRRYTCKDLFHVPFEKKAVVGTKRFSLPGYPCLYLGKSLNCAHEETGSDGVKVVSCFQALKDFDVYDFTFFSPDTKNQFNRLMDNLMSYPIKIAVSIPTPPNTEKETDIIFRAEYLIPQMLLHGVLKHRMGKRPYGLIYTSTKAIEMEFTPDKMCEYTNLVIPTFSFQTKGYCQSLQRTFAMTQPEVVPFAYCNNTEIRDIETNIQNKQFKQLQS